MPAEMDEVSKDTEGPDELDLNMLPQNTVVVKEESKRHTLKDMTGDTSGIPWEEDNQFYNWGIRTP